MSYENYAIIKSIQSYLKDVSIFWYYEAYWRNTNSLRTALYLFDIVYAG